MSNKAPEFIWSNTDFPYMCLKDEFRTLKFRDAINKTIKPEDVVIDIGAGSGIMSFFAADAGASIVHAVEIDHLLSTTLKQSIIANGKQDKIGVIEGDVFKVDLPKAVDVVIAEIIDTGMLEELQVPAMNDLRRRGVIDGHTKIIPARYKTYVQLVYAANTYYGYQILSPKHEWPFYDNKNAGWVNDSISPVSEKVEICDIDFESGIVDESVNVAVDFNLIGPANALMISGVITLCDGIEIGPTNALNGNKILNLGVVTNKHVKMEISYRMSKGLGNFHVQVI